MSEPQDMLTGSENAGDAWLSVAEAAAILGVSERTIRRRCESGKLAAKQGNTATGGVSWQVDRAAILGADKRTDTVRAATNDKVSARPNSEVELKPSDRADKNRPHGQTSGQIDRADMLAVENARLSADLERERDERRRSEDFLRGQIEQHARAEAELRAALREALKLSAKALPSPDESKVIAVAEPAQIRDETPATTPTSPAVESTPEAPPDPQYAAQNHAPPAALTVEPNKVSPAVYGAQASPEFHPTMEELEAEAPPARVPPQNVVEAPAAAVITPWYPPKEQESMWRRFKVWLVGG